MLAQPQGAIDQSLVAPPIQQFILIDYVPVPCRNGIGTAYLKEYRLEVALLDECIFVKIRNKGCIGQGGQFLDMPEPHLEHVFGAVLEQKRKLGFIAVGNTGLADTQRDASDRQVERFEHAIRGSVVREFLRDQNGDSAEFVKQRVGRIPIARTQCERLQCLY